MIDAKGMGSLKTRPSDSHRDIPAVPAQILHLFCARFSWTMTGPRQMTLAFTDRKEGGVERDS